MRILDWRIMMSLASITWVPFANAQSTEEGPLPFTLTAPPSQEEQVKEATDKAPYFMTYYVIATKCADANTVFTTDQLPRMQRFIKEKLALLPQNDKDKIWNVAQNYWNTHVITADMCRDTMQKAQVFFPAQIIAPDNAPPDPF